MMQVWVLVSLPASLDRGQCHVGVSMSVRAAAGLPSDAGCVRSETLSVYTSECVSPETMCHMTARVRVRSLTGMWDVRYA